MADVEPASPLEDGVALIVSRVERAGVDDDLEASGPLLEVVLEHSVHAVELAAFGEKPEVTDFELRQGMVGVERRACSPGRGS